MEFTGFCYSNSRVSLFYFGEMFVWKMGDGNRKQCLLRDYGYPSRSVIAVRTCQEFFED